MGRSPGEGIGYPLQYSLASLVAQLVKNPPAMRETWVNPLVGKIPWRRERLATPVFWPGEFHRLYSPWSHKESDTTERISLSLSPALERHWTYPESSYRFHKNCIEVVCLVVSDFATPWTAAHQSPRSVGILPARILEWVAVSSFRGSSQLWYQTQVSRIGGGFFTD